MEQPIQTTRSDRQATANRTEEVAVIPVVAENVHIGYETRETGRVRVKKTVAEFQENISLPTYITEADVRRVRVDRLLDGSVPSVEQQGDTIIVPILEEVLVTEKRLMLREEVHITLRRREESHQETVTLRREVVSILRDSFVPDDATPQPPLTTDSSRSLP